MCIMTYEDSNWEQKDILNKHILKKYRLFGDVDAPHQLIFVYTHRYTHLNDFKLVFYYKSIRVIGNCAYLIRLVT